MLETQMRAGNAILKALETQKNFLRSKTVYTFVDILLV